MNILTLIERILSNAGSIGPYHEKLLSDGQIKEALLELTISLSSAEKEELLRLSGDKLVAHLICEKWSRFPEYPVASTINPDKVAKAL